MTDRSHTARWTRRLSFVAGLALAAICVAGWASFPGGKAHGVDLRIVANPTGGLAVAPSGVVLSGRELVPGETVAASLAIRNQTGVRFDLRLRTLATSTEELDRVLMVRVDAGGEEIFNGYLGELRSWTRSGFALAPGGSTRVELRVSVPSESFQPGSAKVVLELAPPELTAAR